ncbi:MAG: 4Fe-4S dicluster domain-containing protein [Halodesulfurarchaeum sp.]
MKILSRPDFAEFVDGLIEEDPREVVGVQHDGTKYVYDSLARSDDLRLDYDVTMLPPKKYFLPQRERLMEYGTDEDDFEMVQGYSEAGKIILGVHPYDLVAIEQLDSIFIDTQGDEPYRRKRENSILVGVTMQSVSEWSFAESMGTARTDSGYDLFLTELSEGYAVEIGSSKGSELLESAPTREATVDEVRAVEAEKNESVEQFEKQIDFPPTQLPTLLKATYDEMEVWNDYAEGCLSCGTCNVICPTCYCFDVDVVDYITDEAGSTVRRWDGCLLEDFAAVAGGENFREQRVQRHRHRLMRKGNYIYERYGDIACVGCGRCTQHCVADVADPSEIYNQLWRAANV